MPTSSVVVPLWSLVSFLIVYLVVLLVRQICNQTNQYYKLINEIACTILWLAWCFEMQVVKNEHTQWMTLVIAFIILVVQPQIYEDAFGNPCVLMVSYLRDKVSIQQALQLFLCQLISIPIATLLVCLIWYSLSPLSSAHPKMFEIDQDDFLHVGLPQGILCEALVTFIAFLPELFIKSGILLDLVCASNFIFLGLVFGKFTGACFNSLPITAMSIFFNRQSWTQLIFVYWIGPAIGGILAWRVLVSRNDVKKPKLA